MSDLPPGWVRTSLGEVLERIETGKSFSGEGRPALPNEWGVIKVSAMTYGSFRENENKAVRAAATFSETAEIKPGDLLLSRANTRDYVGASVLVGNCRPRLLLSDKSLRLVPAEAIDRRWLWYALSSPTARQYMSNASSGVKAGMRNISQDSLRSTPLTVPPLAEQRRIVATLEDHLSRLDAAIQIVGSAPSTRFLLEQSIFEAAVTGQLSNQRCDDTPVAISLEKAHSRFADGTAGGRRRVRELPPGAASLLAREKIPHTWRWVEWGQIGYSHNGAAFPSDDYAVRGIRLIRPGNLGADGRITWHPKATRYLPVVYAESRRDLVVPGRALIMNLTAQSLKDQFLGRTCLKMEDGPALLNQRLARLEPVTGELEYLLLVFRSPIFRRFVDELNTGSLIQHIHTWQVDKFMIPLPPVEEQRRIIVSVDELLTMTARGISLTTGTLRRAQNLRRSLLTEAFAGRLVPQVPNDEPASVLLERIRAERAIQSKSKRTWRAKQPDSTQEALL